ncbi:hypothetical protein ACFQZ4_42585 [Catellatospora coxensis]
MLEQWRTIADLDAARQRFEAAIPGWQPPAAFGIARLVSGRAVFARVAVGDGFLPAVALATVCGHRGGSASYPLSPPTSTGSSPCSPPPWPAPNCRTPTCMPGGRCACSSASASTRSPLSRTTCPLNPAIGTSPPCSNRSSRSGERFTGAVRPNRVNRERRRHVQSASRRLENPHGS